MHNLMMNDVACKTIGICSIRMKIFDGQMRIFKDVRHVPDMRKNLLLLGALEAQECKFSVTDRVLKVTKGSIVIVPASNYRNRLTILI